MMTNSSDLITCVTFSSDKELLKFQMFTLFFTQAQVMKHSIVGSFHWKVLSIPFYNKISNRGRGNG
jgi:hypothetical protein